MVRYLCKSFVIKCFYMDIQNANKREDVETLDLIALFKEVYDHRKLVIKVAVVSFVVGVVIAFSLPNKYVSSISFAPESNNDKMSGSTNALVSMIGMGGSTNYGVNEEVYPEILKSTPFVMGLADIPVVCDGKEMPFSDYVLKEQRYPWWSFWKNKSEKEKQKEMNVHESTGIASAYVGMFSQMVSLESEKKTGLYTLKATFQDPDIAKQIADSVLSNLQSYITNYRTTKTRHDVEMNKKMLADARKDYIIADSMYARIVDKNANLVTKSSQVVIERFKNERDLKYNIYQQYASQLALSIIKLQEETPIATVIEPAKVSNAPSSPNVKLVIAAITLLGVFLVVAKIVVKKLLFGEKLEK